jgi:hypothetical protein
MVRQPVNRLMQAVKPNSSVNPQHTLESMLGIIDYVYFILGLDFVIDQILFKLNNAL